MSDGKGPPGGPPPPRRTIAGPGVGLPPAPIPQHPIPPQPSGPYMEGPQAGQAVPPYQPEGPEGPQPYASQPYAQQPSGPSLAAPPDEEVPGSQFVKFLKISSRRALTNSSTRATSLPISSLE